MLKIKIEDTFVSNRSGVSKASGKPYSINTQENCFLQINGEIRKFPQVLEDAQQAYAPGLYEFDAEKLLTLNGFNNLIVAAFSRPKLILVGPLTK